jgi:hypothetical protein
MGDRAHDGRRRELDAGADRVFAGTPARFSNLFASGDGVLFYVDTAGLYVRRL